VAILISSIGNNSGAGNPPANEITSKLSENFSKSLAPDDSFINKRSSTCFLFGTAPVTFLYFKILTIGLIVLPNFESSNAWLKQRDVSVASLKREKCSFVLYVSCKSVLRNKVVKQGYSGCVRHVFSGILKV
jgi:hypothetical protein